jgi:NADH-quinone oxidoreductase subunit K
MEMRRRDFLRESAAGAALLAVLGPRGLAAAEVAVGLAIIVSLFRHKETTDVDDVSLLGGPDS